MESKYFRPSKIKILDFKSDLRKYVFKENSTLQQGTHKIGY